jgi:hypothetical protein
MTKSTNGARYISAVETAKMIRRELKENFPGTKFWVNKKNNSIRIVWVDGPTSKSVDAIVQKFSGSGFDAMIDMKYSVQAYLIGGKVVALESSGTLGSAGSCPAIEAKEEIIVTLLTEAGEKVSFLTDYIFTNRSVTIENVELVAEEFSQVTGWDKPEINTSCLWVNGKKMEDIKVGHFANDFSRQYEIKDFDRALSNRSF